jgi:hypothetical protein
MVSDPQADLPEGLGPYRTPARPKKPSWWSRIRQWFLCRSDVHDWSEWSRPVVVQSPIGNQIQTVNKDDFLVRTLHVVGRRCKACGTVDKDLGWLPEDNSQQE